MSNVLKHYKYALNNDCSPPQSSALGSGTTEDFSLSIFLYHFFFNDEDALFYFVKALVILQLRFIAAAAAKSLQSCPTLCDPTDGSPPGSPIPGILQAGTLEWLPLPSPLLYCASP